MIDYSAIALEKVIIHKVGNKHKDKGNQISKKLCSLNEDISTHLINFFLTPFSKHNEVNKFAHHSDLNMNELYSYSKEIFNQPENFIDTSVKILNHLYAQSDHPHIKMGEVFVVYFSDMIFDDEITNAIGIFKIEKKQNYFNILDGSTNIGIDIAQGVSTKKLDKGCLIINLEEKDGYRLLSVDNNNYDAEYWKNNFMNVEYVKDFYYQTSQYVDFCKSFSEEVIEVEKGKDEQIAFLNKSMNYLSKKDDFNINEFAEEVFEEPVKRKKFFDYKKAYEEQKEMEMDDKFFIAQNTVKAKKKFIKSLINLDTNIQIKLDPKDPDKTRQYIEKGYDRERDMHYYKVYFYSEMK